MNTSIEQRRAWGLAPRVLLVVALASCAITGSCTTGWKPATPRTLFLETPGLAFEAALATVRGIGYEVVELDERRYFIKVAAKTGTMLVVVSHGVSMGSPLTSWITLQVYRGAALRMEAHGRERDRDLISPDLAEELDKLEAEIQKRADMMRAGGIPSASPPAVPSGGVE